MNNPEPKLAFVHESEVQRQHARIRIPGNLVVIQCDQSVVCKLWDISAGGCSFKPPSTDVDLQGLQTGDLQLKINDIGINVTIHFQVIGTDHNTGFTRCAFQDLGARETSVLHHIIGSFIAGELVTAGDVLNTISRENFTKPRANGNGDLEGNARLKAILRTGVATALGVAAFIYAASRIYDLYFVIHATAARVATAAATVSMPRDGVFSSLVPADGAVKKGAPLGSFETLMSDLLESQELARVDRDLLPKIIGKTVKGTIISPCDCRVVAQYVADQEYVGKGQMLFDLVPLDPTPYMLARFLSADVDNINPGTGVKFRISGDDEERKGHVERVRALGRGDEVASEIIADVKPDEPISPKLIGRPASLWTRSFARTHTDVEAGVETSLARIGH